MKPRKKKENIMKRSNWLKMMAIALITCAATVYAADPAPIKGNPDSKVYHKIGCRYYSAKGSSVEFKTEAEAIKAGYTPCKICAVPKTEKKEEQQESSEPEAPKDTE
jgi:hypothetical protein